MRILLDLEYVEQTGHGIPDVVKIYGKEIFDIYDTYINVKIPYNKDVLKSHNKVVSLNSNTQETTPITTPITTQEKIILEIKNNPSISKKELSRLFSLTDNGIKYHLKELTRKGIIIRRGSSRKGYWVVIDNKEKKEK